MVSPDFESNVFFGMPKLPARSMADYSFSPIQEIL